MAKIKVIGVPPGQAPDWVRKEWIGVEIPLLGTFPRNGVLLGVVDGRRISQDQRSTDGYMVTYAEALTALRAKSPKAAKWWDTCVIAKVGQTLVFAREVCEVIS